MKQSQYAQLYHCSLASINWLFMTSSKNSTDGEHVQNEYEQNIDSCGCIPYRNDIRVGFNWTCFTNRDSTISNTWLREKHCHVSGQEERIQAIKTTYILYHFHSELSFNAILITMFSCCTYSQKSLYPICTTKLKYKWKNYTIKTIYGNRK